MNSNLDNQSINTDLNMDEFRKKKEQIDNIKFTTFDKIYKLVIEQIKYSADSLSEYCIYEIPVFMLYEPLYNVKEVSDYIIQKLNIKITENHLSEVKFYEPNIIFIKWSLK
jgi:hypothetical protein